MVLIQNELENGSDDCSLGILIMQNIAIDSSEENLNAVKIDLEQSIREKYRESSRKELQMMHPMDVYVTTYKKFGYTYHVLLQLESIIKGKSISNGLAPVKAMFMAELNNIHKRERSDNGMLKDLILVPAFALKRAGFYLRYMRPLEFATISLNSICVILKHMFDFFRLNREPVR